MARPDPMICVAGLLKEIAVQIHKDIWIHTSLIKTIYVKLLYCESSVICEESRNSLRTCACCANVATAGRLPPRNAPHTTHRFATASFSNVQAAQAQTSGTVLHTTSESIDTCPSSGVYRTKVLLDKSIIDKSIIQYYPDKSITRQKYYSELKPTNTWIWHTRQCCM